jgi:hypothetical protein
MTSPVAENAEQYNDDTQYQIHKKNRIPFNRHKKILITMYGPTRISALL